MKTVDCAEDVLGWGGVIIWPYRGNIGSTCLQFSGASIRGHLKLSRRPRSKPRFGTKIYTYQYPAGAARIFLFTSDLAPGQILEAGRWTSLPKLNPSLTLTMEQWRVPGDAGACLCSADGSPVGQSEVHGDGRLSALMKKARCVVVNR